MPTNTHVTLILLTASIVCQLLFETAWAVQEQQVKEQPGSVAANNQADAETPEESIPDNVALLEGDKVRIETKVFKPPNDYTFKPFDGTNPKHVEVLPGHSAEFPVTPIWDEATKIEIHKVISKEMAHAGIFPLHLEGNLQPKGNGGGATEPPPEMHWAVKVAGLGIHFIRQDNTRFPVTGDDACHMVSKFKTDINLPDSATFAEPPGDSVDPDTFRVEIGSLAGNPPSVKVEIIRDAHSMLMHTFNTVSDGASLWRTDEHIRLVSNTVDDTYLAHQTVPVKLGDTIRATVIQDDNTLGMIELPVGRPPIEQGPKAIRTAALRFVKLEFEADEADLNSAAVISKMNENWAQCAIRFKQQGQVTVVTPVENAIAFSRSPDAAGVITADVQPAGQQQAITVEAEVDQDATPLQMAQAFAAAANAYQGLEATAMRAFDGVFERALVIINKGTHVSFANVSVPDGALYLVVDYNINVQPIVSFLAANMTAFNLKDTADHAIDVFFAKRADASGYAGAVDDNTVVPALAGTFLFSSEATPFTPGHEVGHVFGLGHVPTVLTNLMKSGGTSSTDGLSASKRLTDEQNASAREDSGTLLVAE